VFIATSGEVHADDPDDPSRTLIRQVMGAVIEFEKRQAVKRRHDGMLAKAAIGRKVTGQGAYGYRGQGKGHTRDAAPDPDEQGRIRVIMELREVSCYYREIVTALHQAGHKPKRGTQWLPMTIKRIHDRETKRATQVDQVIARS
jgi:DNA invertase Pin-like site-specific DNA recombinase